MFSIPFLFDMGLAQVGIRIKQRIFDIECQEDLNNVRKFCIKEEVRYIAAPAPYLFRLEIPSHRRAFTLGQCDSLPSAVVEGRFWKVPFLEQLCPCETRNHQSCFAGLRFL